MTLDLDALFRELDPRLRAYFGRRVPSADADDLAATVWLKVVRAAPRYRDYGTPRRWVWQIAANVLTDYRRHAAALTLVPLDPACHDAPTPEDGYAQVERCLLLDPLVARLGPDHRAVIEARFYAGLDEREAAAHLGLALNVTKKRQYRAVRVLRRLLGEVA